MPFPETVNEGKIIISIKKDFQRLNNYLRLTIRLFVRKAKKNQSAINIF